MDHRDIVNGLNIMGGFRTVTSVLEMDLLNVPLILWGKSFGSVAKICVEMFLRKIEMKNSSSIHSCLSKVPHKKRTQPWSKTRGREWMDSLVEIIPYEC